MSMSSSRYSPWWMPAVCILLLLVCIVLFYSLAFKTVTRNMSVSPIADTDSGLMPKTAYTWNLVTSWPENFPGLGTAPENFAKLVNEMSHGRLVIDVHGANAIVPALGVFDAVSSGSVEMGHSAAYYWKGKIAASPFFTSVPFGMNAQEYNGWLHYGGGLALWREIYAPFNLIPFAGGNTGVQMGGWFNKEINTIDDIRELKMRIPGLGGEVFSRAGGVAVNIAGSELYTSLQSGVVDAAEWVGPYNDLAFGFHQIAKYYYYPGWQEPGPALEFIINKQAYEQLPIDLQKIVEVATRAINQDMMDEYSQRSAGALKELRDVHDVDIRVFPKDVLAAYREAAISVYNEYAKNDPVFNKVYTSYFSYLYAAKEYSEISEQAYYENRNR